MNYALPAPLRIRDLTDRFFTFFVVFFTVFPKMSGFPPLFDHFPGEKFHFPVFFQ